MSEHDRRIIELVAGLCYDDVSEALTGKELLELHGYDTGIHKPEAAFEATRQADLQTDTSPKEAGVIDFMLRCRLEVVCMPEGDWGYNVRVIGSYDPATDEIAVVRVATQDDCHDWRAALHGRVMDVKIPESMLDRTEVTGTGLSVLDLIEAIVAGGNMPEAMLGKMGRFARSKVLEEA